MDAPVDTAHLTAAETRNHRRDARGVALMAEAQFRVTVGSDQKPIVVASGDIDLVNVDDFQVVMTNAATDASVLTVDLSEVTYCDSAAMRALFAVAAMTEVTMVVSQNGPIKTLLAISGLDRVAAVVTRE